jgi:hypothetical protein
MTTTRITNDEQALLDSRLTSHERRVLDWYRQFEDTYAEKLQVNYKIHTSLSTAIKNCDVRELAWQMQRAIQHRAWEDMPEYPGSPTQGKVLHLSFTEWVEEYLFTNVDGLVRIMSGHLPQANEAGEAVIAVIDAVHAEDPQMLKTLMSDYSTEGSNLPGWQKLIASKAAECNGKWTEAASHLADITAGKVGAPEGNDNAAKDKNNAPSGGALNDDSKQAGKRQPKSERERQRIRYRGLKDSPEACSKLGITTEGAQAAFDAMCRSRTISLAEVARIAGFKENPRKRIELSGALTPAQAKAKLIAFYGEEWFAELSK